MFVDTIYDDQSPRSIYHKNQPFMNQYNPKIAIYFLDIHVRYPFVQCQGAEYTIRSFLSLSHATLQLRVCARNFLPGGSLHRAIHTGARGWFLLKLGSGTDQLTRPWKSSRRNKDSVFGDNPWSKDCRSYQGESSKILLGNMVVQQFCLVLVLANQNGRVFGMVI